MCTVCIGHEYALPCRVGMTVIVGRISTVRLAPAIMFATIVIPTQSSSHGWRSEGIAVPGTMSDKGTFAAPQRVSQRLLEWPFQSVRQ